MKKTMLRDEVCPICGEGRIKVWIEKSDDEKADIRQQFCKCRAIGIKFIETSSVALFSKLASTKDWGNR